VVSQNRCLASADRRERNSSRHAIRYVHLARPQNLCARAGAEDSARVEAESEKAGLIFCRRSKTNPHNALTVLPVVDRSVPAFRLLSHSKIA
jgi:hypothetical protein